MVGGAVLDGVLKKRLLKLTVMIHSTIQQGRKTFKMGYCAAFRRVRRVRRAILQS